MSEIAGLRDSLKALDRRLRGRPHGDDIRAVYLELVTLSAQIQGALGGRERGGEDVQEARQALDVCQATLRKVGLDIRLASPAALQIGLQTALASAQETLNRLES